MALHLNLLHEIESARRARQRDPLKLGLYALGFVVLCFLGYYALRLSTTNGVVRKKNTLEQEWNNLNPQQTAAIARAEELRAQIALSANAVKFIESRFYWAPLLERLGHLVPPAVQISRIAGDISGRDSCTLSLEGLAAGREPRTVAESLRTTLANDLLGGEGSVDSTFVSLEDGSSQAVVRGVALPTAVFTIRLVVTLPDPQTEITAP